jgi:putative Mn2+ efflux pump MntP
MINALILLASGYEDLIYLGAVLFIILVFVGAYMLLQEVGKLVDKLRTKNKQKKVYKRSVLLVV